ncbi:MAG: ion transporter [Alphaproteobacteria bacterium]|nr:ion transporter [Alphaproteobacteria bacterium]
MTKSTRKTLATWRDRWSDPLLTVLTVLLFLIIFVIAPLRGDGLPGAQDIGLAISVIIIGAIVVLSGDVIAIGVIVVAFGMTIVAAVLRLHGLFPLDVYVQASAWLVIGIALIWVVSKAVFAAGRITYHRVMGAILLYLSIGWTFAGLFTLMALIVPGAFSGFTVTDRPALAADVFYLSFGTLTTAGAGDITPVHPMARSLVNILTMIGQLYPATLLARLVTLEIEDESRG